MLPDDTYRVRDYDGETTRHGRTREEDRQRQEGKRNATKIKELALNQGLSDADFLALVAKEPAKYLQDKNIKVNQSLPLDAINPHAASREEMIRGELEIVKQAYIAINTQHMMGRDVTRYLLMVAERLGAANERMFGKLNVNQNMNVNMNELSSDYERFRDTVMRVLNRERPDLWGVILEEFAPTSYVDGEVKD